MFEGFYGNTEGDFDGNVEGILGAFFFLSMPSGSVEVRKKVLQ